MYSSALASTFGKKIFVGVCSTIVRLIGLCSTSLALCVARHITPFSLRQVFGPSFAKLANSGVREQPPELVHPADEAPAVEKAAHEMEEIQRYRRTHYLVLEEIRDIKADDAAGVQDARRQSRPRCRTPRRSRPLVLAHQRARRACTPSGSVGSRNSMSRDRRRAGGSSARVPRRAWSRSASSRTVKRAQPLGPHQMCAATASEIRRRRGVRGSCSGLKPVGAPFLSGRYSPPRARTRISRPRSLSNITWVTPWRASIATRKPMNTVLPDPVGPQMNVWPVSLRLPPSASADCSRASEK